MIFLFFYVCFVCIGGTLVRRAFRMPAKEFGVPVLRARKVPPGQMTGRYRRLWVTGVVALGVFAAGSRRVHPTRRCANVSIAGRIRKLENEIAGFGPELRR